MPQIIKKYFSVLIALSLTGCVYTPHRVSTYDEQCQVYAKHWTLRAESFDSANCSGNGCLQFLIGVGAVASASAVISGSVVLIGNTFYWFEKRKGCPDNTQVVVSTQLTSGNSQWSEFSAVAPGPDRTRTFPVICELETSQRAFPSQLPIQWPSQVKKAAVLSTTMSSTNALLKVVGNPLGSVQQKTEMMFVSCLPKTGLEAVAAHAVIPTVTEYSPKAILSELQAQHVDAIMRITPLGIRWFSLRPTKSVSDKTYKNIDSALQILMGCLPAI